MIEGNLLILTGAGASLPYLMPSTSDMAGEIIKNTFNRLYGHLKDELEIHALKERNDIFTQTFAESGCESIDQFLYHRREYADIGKHSMAAILHRYQTRSCKLFDGFKSDQNWLRIS